LVGSITPETRGLLSKDHYLADFVSKEPQDQLPKHYAWGDLFVFPTIEDGFAQVLAQAQASGLPILATTNCAAPDLIEEGRTGWVLPIRSPESFIEKLKWCDTHRQELAQMVEWVYNQPPRFDWNKVAGEFERAFLVHWRK